jgi:tRNA A-37 threonylcarbamoyl transferase component Bud32
MASAPHPLPASHAGVITEAPPGPLLASGRDADVFALDRSRVLRCYRSRPVPEREVAAMRYVRQRGYPVPEVHEVSGPDLVLERVDGPTMVDDMTRRPWRVGVHARALADLHRRLHAIAPPDFMPGDGRAIVHLDLHPLNVILGERRPVVIDWANAQRGEPEVDVALTAVVLAGTSLHPPLAWLRNRFVRAFLGSFSDDEWRGGLDRALAYRGADANVTDVGGHSTLREL